MHIFPRLFFKTARPSFRSFWKKKNLSFPSHTHKHIPRKQSALKIESWAPFSLWPESDFAEKKKYLGNARGVSSFVHLSPRILFPAEKKKPPVQTVAGGRRYGRFTSVWTFFFLFAGIREWRKCLFFCFSSVPGKRQDLISYVCWSEN